MNFLLVPNYITFADVYNGDGCVDIPVGYKNLEWTGFKCSYKAYQNHCYRYNIIYTNNNSGFVACCSGSGSISVRRLNMLFGVISLDVGIPDPWNFHLTITGYRKSMHINTDTSNFIGPGYRHIDLHWTDIDELKFCSSGHFLLTDLLLTRSF
jgi:hypothetical protein